LLATLRRVAAVLSERFPVPADAARSARRGWEVRAAVRQARTVCDSHPAPVRICWDLDNTLANSGTLLRAGRALQEAVVETEPVPNMLEFYSAMQARLPHADHFILSARARSLRPDTLRWLERYGLASGDGAVCFVPYAEAKSRVWRQLARDSKLIIVDDLSYNHEADEPSIYDDLVGLARQTACVYIGLDEITQITANSTAIDAVASKALESLTA
jgi:hypothetical protein